MGWWAEVAVNALSAASISFPSSQKDEGHWQLSPLFVCPIADSMV